MQSKTKRKCIASNNSLITEDEDNNKEEECSHWSRLETQQLPVCADRISMDKIQGAGKQDKIIPYQTIMPQVVPVKKTLAITHSNNISRGQVEERGSKRYLCADYNSESIFQDNACNKRQKLSMPIVRNQEKKPQEERHYRNSNGKLVRKDLSYDICRWLKYQSWR